MSPPAFPPDLRSRYEELGVLGAGGFGAVYRCRDLELGRDVAVKLLGRADPDERRRFDREAALTAEIRHPNVVEVYDYGVAATGEPFLVYELVEGRSFRQVCEAGPAAPEDVRGWAIQGARALDALHARGVVHRDVKPGNVMLTEEGRVVLLDFGLARPAAGGMTVTREGLILGTPSFMAPELWRGEPAGPAADQFAWGATLLELLRGETPYGTGEPAKILAGLGTWGPSLDPHAPGLEGVLVRALQPRPGDRFGSVADMLAALEMEPGGPGAGAFPSPGLEATGVLPDRAAPTRTIPAPPARPRDPVSPTRVLVARPGGTGGRGRAFGLGLLGLALAGLVVVGARRRAAPAPPPPPPDPVRSPARTFDPRRLEEATARLRESEAAFRVAYLGEGHATPWEYPDREVALRTCLPVFLDPDARLRWHRLVRDAARWVAAGRGQPGGAARDAWRDVLAAIHAALARVVRMIAYLTRAGVPLQYLDQRGFLPPSDAFEAARRAWTQETLAGLEAAGDIPGIPGIEEAWFHLGIGGFLAPGAEPPGLEALLAALGRGVDSWQFPRVLEGLRGVLSERDRPAELTCGARVRALRALHALEGERPDSRLVSLSHSFRLGATTEGLCPGAGAAEVAEDAARRLEEHVALRERRVRAGEVLPGLPASRRVLGALGAYLEDDGVDAADPRVEAARRWEGRLARLEWWSRAPRPKVAPREFPEVPPGVRPLFEAASRVEAIVARKASGEPFRGMIGKRMDGWTAPGFLDPALPEELARFVRVAVQWIHDVDDAGRWEQSLGPERGTEGDFLRYELVPGLRRLQQGINPMTARLMDAKDPVQGRGLYAAALDYRDLICAETEGLLAEEADVHRLAAALLLRVPCRDPHRDEWGARAVARIEASPTPTRLRRIPGFFLDLASDLGRWGRETCTQRVAFARRGLALTRLAGSSRTLQWPTIEAGRAVERWVSSFAHCPPDAPPTELLETIRGLDPTTVDGQDRRRLQERLRESAEFVEGRRSGLFEQEVAAALREALARFE